MTRRVSGGLKPVSSSRSNSAFSSGLGSARATAMALPRRCSAFQSSITNSPPGRSRGKSVSNEARVASRRCEASSMTSPSGSSPNSSSRIDASRSRSAWSTP